MSTVELEESDRKRIKLLDSDSEGAGNDQETFLEEKAKIITGIDKAKPDEEWLPPTLRNMDNKFNSITYDLGIPIGLSNGVDEDDSIILGVDEAGRGPILGPMVYSVSYCKNSFNKQLKKYGFDDSKVLKHDFRLKLYKLIDEESHELHDNIGYLTTLISAKDISSGMLKVHDSGNYNLNQQAHDTTINLLRLALPQVNISHVYIDTVGPPQKYQDKLYGIFGSNYPNLKFTVTKKADSLYPIVSCASIIAKVTRDLYLDHYNHTDKLLIGTVLGSGYPSDPNTSAWLKENIDKQFGWHNGLLRFSWQTARDNLEKHGACKVDNETADTVIHSTNQFNLTLDYYGGSVDI